MSATGSTDVKRVPLEALSKEELLQKCKALLSIAQRAKIAKDEAIKESHDLKEEVEALKGNKRKDEASAEILEALTQQKLQLTIQLDEARSLSHATKRENDELRAKLADQEVQIESFRRQLSRSESDYNALEAQLEKLDSENHMLAAVANEAEAQLRRGAVERQDVLEGLGDELANVKNAAAEALAERDRLRAQLQQQSPNSNFQVLEACHVMVQELRSSQSLLRSDVGQLQSAAQVMAVELGQALAEAQAATDEAARHSSKDLLAEMNEAMKMRGEVAAQLASKLSAVERERDGLIATQEDSTKKLKALEEKCKSLQEMTQVNVSVQSKLQESEDKIATLLKSQEESSQKLSTLQDTIKEKETCELELTQIKERLNQVMLDKSKLENQFAEHTQQSDMELKSKNAQLADCQELVKSLESKLKDLEPLQKEHEVLKLEVMELQSKLEELSSISEEDNGRMSATTDCSSQDKKQQEGGNKESNEAHPNLMDEVIEPECISIKNVYISDTQNTIKELGNDNETTNVPCTEQTSVDVQLQCDFLQEERDALTTASKTIERLELELTELSNIATERDDFKVVADKLISQNEEIVEQNKHLEEELRRLTEFETTVTKEIEELTSKNKELTELTVNLKERIGELEREECEVGSVSTVSRAEDAARLRDVEESFEDRYTKLRAVAVKLKQKCHDQAGLLSKVLSERTDLQNKLTACSKDRDTLAKNLQSIQAACDAATDEAEAAHEKFTQSTKELKRAAEDLAKAKNQHAEAVEKMEVLESKLQHALTSLETAKQESKKSSMLNLEMAAYERSAAEQDKKLMQLKDEVTSLKAELENQKKIANEHEETARVREESCNQLRSEKAKLEELLTQTKAQLNEARTLHTTENQKLSEAVMRYEAKHSELERVELQLAEVTAQKLRNDENAKTFQEQAARQIRLLEEQVSSVTATVQAREDELQTLQAEFEGYKVRAQGVLNRQLKQQTVKEDSSKEAELESELSVLKSTLERLQTTLCDGVEREKLLQSENAVLMGHNSALQVSARNLANQVAELNAKCEELKNKLLKNEESLREANRQHRLALDTLASSYKQQLTEAEKRHKAQIANLQAAQEEMKEMTYQMQSPLVDHEQQPVLQQREEGEGSENVDSLKTILNADHRREPLPLDRLLSSSSDYHDDAKSEISLDAASVSSVLAAEKRAKHLASLLGEAEADLARLAQQNSVLKEEIRRQQRCMDRQQHTLSNGEYLKNVVLKFITLQGGDERVRLVPVLNTILKLSPEETQQVQLVAAGTPPGGAAAAASSSWGSYLHLWSGTH